MFIIKVLSLFSGIGAFESSLRNIGVDYELVGYSEIDKYAARAFSLIHNQPEENNLGDVTKINKEELPDFDLLVGGSPCQSFSVAGQRKGFEDTRGTLFFDYVETLVKKQPKYFVYENVKGLVNHDKGNTLDTMIQALCDAGYTLDFNVLNSKFFNVPQNRERIYIIGILNHETKEWVIDKKKGIVEKGKIRLQKNLHNLKTFNFNWPKQEVISKRLRDILETDVDESFYLSEEKTSKLIDKLIEDNKEFKEGTCVDPINMGRGEIRAYTEHTPTLNGRDYKEPRMVIEEPKVVVHNIPQTVRVRKHEVNIDKLRSLLRDRKKQEGVTNKQIAVKLNRPVTEVEHWFRTDNCFSIPDADIWFQLKDILHINTEEFDLPVTEFIEREGVFEKADRCYDIDGLSPTLTRASADEKIVEPTRAIALSNIYGGFKEDAPRVHGEISPTIRTAKGGGHIPSVLESDDPRSCSTRTRSYMNQPEKLEVRQDNVSNTVTSVAKDSMVLTQKPKYRIRKLTPKECLRLQAFSDDDFNKLQEDGISNTQIYKMAGNSITVSVLEEIFKQLLHK